LPNPHEYLRDLRAFLNRRTGDAILLGEVNLDHKQQLEFFGGADGDELHMQFDFIGMQRLYLSLARQDAAPLVDALITRPQPQPESQWASFVRNHDELTLDKLSEAERQEVFAAFGPEPEMQVFGRGLIRRLPPMLGGDPRRIRMVYSLLFSLPGTPVLFYGEEIGMGENLEAGDRLAVRTPMQWSTEKNGGFSNAPRSRLSGQLPDGPYGPEFVNVVDQQHDPDSLLNFIRKVAHNYRDCPELGWGTLEIMEQPYAAVLAHRCTWDDASIVLLHNLSPDAVTVPLTLSNCIEGTRLSDLLSTDAIQPDARGRLEVALEGYGYRWLRVLAPHSRRLS
jgi:glycosidase